MLRDLQNYMLYRLQKPWETLVDYVNKDNFLFILLSPEIKLEDVFQTEITGLNPLTSAAVVSISQKSVDYS